MNWLKFIWIKKYFKERYLIKRLLSFFEDKGGREEKKKKK
jgi:hypothetical protein